MGFADDLHHDPPRSPPELRFFFGISRRWDYEVRLQRARIWGVVGKNVVFESELLPDHDEIHLAATLSYRGHSVNSHYFISMILAASLMHVEIQHKSIIVKT